MDDKRLAEIEADIRKADNNDGINCVVNLMDDTRELIAEIRAMKAREAEMLEALKYAQNSVFCTVANLRNSKARRGHEVALAKIEDAIAKAEGRS